MTVGEDTTRGQEHHFESKESSLRSAFGAGDKGATAATGCHSGQGNNLCNALEHWIFARRGQRHDQI